MMQTVHVSKPEGTPSLQNVAHHANKGQKL